jgi:hypothetical protein
MLLSSAPVLAAADTVPDICKAVVNYTAQTLDLRLEDGTWSDGLNPKKIVLKRNDAQYPADIKFLGNCDQDYNSLKQTWCRVAGGSPDVYEAKVTKNEGKNGSYPFATVIVTYNRGGCHVDEAARD